MKKTHGGKRNGAGRKPAARKKEPLFLYVFADVLDAIGRDQAKAIGENSIYRKAKALGVNKNVDNLA